MGQRTDLLIHKRSNRRKLGALLSVVGASGFLLTLYFGLHTLLSLRGRNAALGAPEDYYPTGDPGKLILIWLVTLLSFVACLVAGMLVLQSAQRITRELKDTEAEISRRLRVEEGLRERRRAGAH